MAESTSSSSSSTSSSTSTSKPKDAGLGVFILRPIDPLADPFPWAGVPYRVIVAAESDKQARAFASAAATSNDADAWLDDAQTTCEPLAPSETGVIARDMTL